MSRCILWFVMLGLVTSFYNDLLHANGLRVLGVKSTKATAMGEAFIAQADDPSAIAFNPAGLTQLDGIQASTGVTITNGWPEHKSPSGAKEEMLDEWQYIPNCFVTSDLNTENLVIGIGITVPNGLASEWSDTGFARYVDTYSDLTVIDVNPSLGWEVVKDLSIGFGVSIYYSQVTLESMIDYETSMGLSGALDGKRGLKGDGYAFGYNLGILYSINDHHNFAAAFKSPFKLEYEGDFELTNIPDSIGIGPSYKTSGETSFDFPATVVIGYAYRPVEELKLEFNIDWTNWETLDSVVIKIDSPVPPLLPDRITQEYGYENTFAYKFGLEYKVNEYICLRAGYIYNENAVPDENWRPNLPDTDMQFLTSGLGFRKGNLSIDGALQLIFYEDRTINNNVDYNEISSSSSIDGEYENFAVGYSVSVTYGF
ncbi:MAG: outer membrane protein transport protein [Spirochaetota bacterium]|nr:outer membrane protein transport protein [Spirochaetota bacterium]